MILFPDIVLWEFLFCALIYDRQNLFTLQDPQKNRGNQAEHHIYGRRYEVQAESHDQIFEPGVLTEAGGQNAFH